MAILATQRTTVLLTKNMTDNLKLNITTKSHEAWHEKKKRKNRESVQDCADKLKKIKSDARLSRNPNRHDFA